MSAIGTLQRKDKGGYTLKIRTLTQRLEADLVPVEEKRSAHSPDYRIFLKDRTEVGAAWENTGEKGNAYVSVQLDGPFLPKPLTANSHTREDGTIVLLWTRS